MFGQPLELVASERASITLESEAVPCEEKPEPSYLREDVEVEVPLFIVQCCQAIRKNCGVEGLFRKAGSAARQREMKRLLDKGEGIKSSYDVIDLANILKQFLRDLPDPLIPYNLHEVLLK